MKKLLLIAFSFFLLQIASAQKIHFTDPSNFWGSYGPFDADSYYSVSYDYSSGTLIYNGKTYMELSIIYYAPTFGEGASISIREDTAKGLVYEMKWDSIEHILFNYNLHPGDTIHFNYHSPPYIDSVLSVDSTLINGVYHKVFSLYDISPTNGYYTYVEGLGGINQLECERIIGACSGETLSCFQNNGSHPAMNIPYQDSTTIKTMFNFTNSCFKAGIETISAAHNGSNAILFPNPATSMLSVSAPYNITNIAISNLIGQTIYIHKYNSLQVQVDVSTLPAGIYFVRINGTEVRRFVKE